MGSLLWCVWFVLSVVCCVVGGVVGGGWRVVRCVLCGVWCVVAPVACSLFLFPPNQSTPPVSGLFGSALAPVCQRERAVDPRPSSHRHSLCRPSLRLLHLLPSPPSFLRPPCVCPASRPCCPVCALHRTRSQPLTPGPPAPTCSNVLATLLASLATQASAAVRLRPEACWAGLGWAGLGTVRGWGWGW